MRATNRPLYRLSYAGLGSILTKGEIGKRKANENLGRMRILRVKLCGLRRKFRLDGASVHQRLVFLLRFTRQEDPQRVHTDRRPYGNINEQNEERQNQRQDAGPRF